MGLNRNLLPSTTAATECSMFSLRRHSSSPWCLPDRPADASPDPSGGSSPAELHGQPRRPGASISRPLMESSRRWQVNPMVCAISTRLAPTVAGAQSSPSIPAPLAQNVAVHQRCGEPAEAAAPVAVEGRAVWWPSGRRDPDAASGAGCPEQPQPFLPG